MNRKTLKALKGSIAKWTAIVDSTDAVDDGSDDCPLCLIHLNRFSPVRCFNCPVRIATSFGGCQNTPYEAWAKHHKEKHRLGWAYRRVRGCSTCMRLAMSERDFLKGLLPKKEASK